MWWYIPHHLVQLIVLVIWDFFRNVVSTANLKCKLDLKEIALKCRNAEYNPKRFAAVIMRLRDPKTTALVFESGTKFKYFWTKY